MAIPSPTDIMNMTIRDLLADPDLEFHKEGSTLTFSTAEGIITIQPPKDGKVKAASPAKTTKVPKLTKVIPSSSSGHKRGPKGPRPNSRIMEFGPKILELRAQHKTHREIGEILGVSTAYVGNIERKFRTRKYQELAKAMAAEAAAKATKAAEQAEEKVAEKAAEQAAATPEVTEPSTAAPAAQE